ncbi:peroxisomal membrane protein PMP22-like isoform X2 [Hordeum vulgare subsp. vulgare]|uniref:peroxisomal membrane protein PMP22-like isoform X2 n=1 Tax=Hordeum vulgare subsp. vulgare TaxID=112509 RepID=UPI001D1A399E|nr:peroxisomal membrane protein PMP22-like isoform X2 [Hordeum vulgare subsp. vulgare]
MAGGIGGVGGGTGGEDSLARRAWRQYLLQLQRHPLRTKASVTPWRRSSLDIRRLRSAASCSRWCCWSRSLPHPGTIYSSYSIMDMLLRILCLGWSTPLFFWEVYSTATHGLLASRNAERPFKEVKIRVKKQYLSVQLSAWMFWPVVGWINHQYVPLQFRVIVHSFVACCWGIFLNLRARAMSLKQS